MDRTTWIDRFATHLTALGVKANPDQIVDMSGQLHQKQGGQDPVKVAQTEWDEWPPSQ